MPPLPATETAADLAIAARRVAAAGTPDAVRWPDAPRIATRRACRGQAGAGLAVPVARPLRVDGPPTSMVTIADHEALPVHEQLIADALIAELEAQARRALRSGTASPALMDEERYPSMAQWLALRGTALALHPLHRPSSARLAHGFEFSDFLAPRWHGNSAVDVLRGLLGAERAGRIVERHRAFCDAPISAEARLLLTGSADARAIRQRSAIAAHQVAALGDRWQRGVRIAAVGAGSGDAAAELAARLDTRSLTLIDRDPMALAAAHVVSCGRLPGATVRPVVAAGAAAAALAGQARGGFDVIDLRGALGTLDDAGGAALLRAARAALRPGGVIVAANMLADRPQQTFLDHVLRWPAVMQRSPTQLARVIERAGFDTHQVSLAIPATAPVCVIATVDTAA